MNRVQDVIFGVTGQSLAFVAPEGRASSITSSQVFENIDGDDGTAESALSGSAAVDTNPNTTFDAASGVSQSNRRTCNLAATTGINIWGAQPDQTLGVYLATAAATNEREWIEVSAIADGASVTARNPLRNDFANADTFVTTRIAHAIDATWIADSNNISEGASPQPRYRWRLVYVVNSITYVHDCYFDLVRYVGATDITPTDIERHLPGWGAMLPSFQIEDGGAGLIITAYNLVRKDLLLEGKPDEQARNQELIDELTILKTIELTVRSQYMSGESDAERYELARRDYGELLDKSVRITSRIPFATDTGGGAREVSARSISRR